MKRTYTAPKLTSFGNVTDITQVTGNPTRGDAIYLNGEVVSGNNDVDSLDLICNGPSLKNANCKSGTF